MSDSIGADAGVPDAAPVDAGPPIVDAGVYIEAPAGLEPPIWLSQAEIDAGRTLISSLLNLVPYVGAPKGLYEAWTGKDMLTGAELATWERALNVVGAAASAVKGVAKVSDAWKTAGAAAGGAKLLKASPDVVNALNAMPHLAEIGHRGYVAIHWASSGDIAALLKAVDMATKGVGATQVAKALGGLADSYSDAIEADVPGLGDDGLAWMPNRPAHRATRRSWRVGWDRWTQRLATDPGRRRRSTRRGMGGRTAVRSCMRMRACQWTSCRLSTHRLRPRSTPPVTAGRTAARWRLAASRSWWSRPRTVTSRRERRRSTRRVTGGPTAARSWRVTRPSRWMTPQASTNRLRPRSTRQATGGPTAVRSWTAATTVVWRSARRTCRTRRPPSTSQPGRRRSTRRVMAGPTAVRWWTSANPSRQRSSRTMVSEQQGRATMGNDDGVLEQARRLLAANDPGAVIEVLSRTRSARALGAEETWLLGVAHFRRHDFAGSEELFRCTIAMKPDSHLAVYYLGLALERQGRDDDAMAAFRTSVKLAPGFADGLRKVNQEPQPAVAAPAAAPAAVPRSRQARSQPAPMSDFFIPDGQAELDDYRARKTRKERAQYSIAWRSTPWPIRIVQLLLLVVVLAFLGFIGAMLVPEILAELRS